MSARTKVEYCRHCQRDVICTWKGSALYCQYDHYVRPRYKSNRGKKKQISAKRLEELYREYQVEIDLTFKGKGFYDWDSLIFWCNHRGFGDLADLCRTMKEVDAA